MKLTTHASLRSACGWQPTSFCQRAVSAKTSAAAARLATSYRDTADELTVTSDAPIETKPARDVSEGRTSGVLIAPSKSESAFVYSDWVRSLNFGPPLIGSPGIPAPPPAAVPAPALAPPPLCP